jgi:hypothetical protein
MTTAATKLTFAQIEALWLQAGGAPAYAATMAGIAEAESGGYVEAVAGSSPGAAASTSTDGYGGSYGLWQINGSHDAGSAASTDATAPANGGATPSAAFVSAMENPLYNAQEAVLLLGNGSGMSAWTNDPVGNAALAAGGPLTLSEVLGAHASDATGAVDYLLVTPTTTGMNAFIKGVLGSTAPGLNAQFTDLKNFWNAGVWAGGAGAGGSGGSKSGQGGVDSIGPNPPDILGTVDSIGGLISEITSGAFWIRIGEFLLAGLLVIFGSILFFKSTATGQKVEGLATSAATAAAV